LAGRRFTRASAFGRAQASSPPRTAFARPDFVLPGAVLVPTSSGNARRAPGSTKFEWAPPQKLQQGGVEVELSTVAALCGCVRDLGEGDPPGGGAPAVAALCGCNS